MSVVAKFVCTEITESFDQYSGQQNSKRVRFNVAAGPQNKTWTKYTPGGTLEMTITNPDAYNQFILGQAFLLTFTPTSLKEEDEQKG